MNSIPHHRLGTTDLTLSTICYGTLHFGSSVRGEDVDRLINIYRDSGGNFLDSAHCYGFWGPGGAGASECALADYVRRNGKGDLVIATKGGHPSVKGYRTVEHWLGPSRIEADIDDSLGRLETDVIDLYWLHRDETCLPVAEIMETLNREIARGRIRWLGASNWRPARLAEANAYVAAHGLQGFVASQPGWSLAKSNTPNPAPATDRSNGNVALFLEEVDQQWHRETGLPVVPYSATAAGYFASGGQRARQAYDNPVSAARLVRAQALAKELSVTPGQVALAWLMHQAFPVFPIIGPLDPDHLRENLGAGNMHLTREQVDFLVAPAERTASIEEEHGA